jgi:hypothetical protein
MSWLESVENTYPLLQPGHLQPTQGRILRLFDPFELHPEEVDLELLVDMVMLEFTVHPDITIEAPVPVVLDCLVQGPIGHQGPLEQLQEPVRRGHDHVVVVAVIIGGCIDLLDPGDIVRPMLFRESHNMSIRELLDPVSRLPHPILDGDCIAWTAAIAIEYLPLGAFFGGEGGPVVNKPRPKILKLFSLGVTLPRPLFTILLVLLLLLLKSSDKAPSDIGDSVEIVCNLDGGGSSAGRVDGTGVIHGFDSGGSRREIGGVRGGQVRTVDAILVDGFGLDD